MSMTTRRKSKAHADLPQLLIELPDDIDEDALKDVLPEDFNVCSPSTEDVLSLYRTLISHSSDLEALQRELDDAHAEAEKKDVELDQALQDKETVTNKLEGELQGVQEELTKVKEERDKLVSTQNEMNSKIASLASSRSSSSSEVQEVKRQLEDTEREKRDLLGVISRLKAEGSQQEEEIQTLRNNLKAARQEHQSLESQVRELRSGETSTKFKIDSLQQQLTLSQSESERLTLELNTKSEDFIKYRRTKQAELLTLQASVDDLTAREESAQATLKALQTSHANQTREYTQALSKVQDLTGRLAEQETTYANESRTLKRLVTILEEREKQAKAIVDGIEDQWAGVTEQADKKHALLKDDLDREKKAREEAEKKLDQLELVLEKMGRGELPVPGGRMSLPAADELTDGMMGLSPTVAMASKAQKTGKTFTEVYAEYVRLQDELARKSAEYDHMDRTLSAVLAQIEERAPILSQQRTEYERIQQEASQLATQLSQALLERDAQRTLAQDNAQRYAKSQRENELLQQQLVDLSRQVQTLLAEIGRRDDPSIPADLDHVPASDDVEGVITNHLVLFKSIPQLQEQNQKLLKITRELGKKMEGEERDYRETMEKEQAEAIREAHEAMKDLAEQMERQKKSSEGIIKAYMKERDSLRDMLNRVQPGQQTNGTGARVELALVPSGGSGGGTLEKDLQEIQTQFDVYRTEMTVDSVRAREEAVVAQREISHLSTALAKANARADYLSERYRMNQEQYALQTSELDTLTKRNQQLFDQWTRIDIECGRVSEDLQIATGKIETLRNECANLRAEKKIWESVQGRLVDENRTLAMERSHLSDLMGNVQKMHNDLERSGENDRRRLESQLQMLEGQTQDLRNQLSQERDTLRHITLQKDIELKELQNRLDKSVQDLSTTREILIGAETSKTHLEQRVSDLTRQLKGDQEKLAVYERRPTGAGVTPSTSSSELSREQQLEAEVADLRSSLKVAEVDLASARGHVQQFQEISQANEAALAGLNISFDEYRTSTEAQIAKHESDYKALQEKLELAQKELSELKAKYNEAQKMLEAERKAWSSDKKTLEDTIFELTTSERNSEGDKNARENEVRAQEERTKAAERRYSHEVLAHAESIKQIELLRKDLLDTQAVVREHKTAAETATAKLSASESSWKQQKEAMDKEVSDLNSRCRDLVLQNNVLHQHLESVSSQAARIKQAADSSVTPAAEGETADEGDAKLGELRSVVAYLRREKEVVDLQLELSKQENVRLKSQVEHLSQALDETRATLSEERERAIASTASATQHAELLERINQLNILRESNATLRADCERHAKRARELDAKLKEVSAQLEPATEQVRIAQAESQARDAQVKRLEEENRKWQERNAQLLTKYDRIDPAEVQALKDEIEELKSQKLQIQNLAAERELVSASQAEALARAVATETRLKEIHTKNTTLFRAKMEAAKIDKENFEKEKTEMQAIIASLQQQIKDLSESKAAAEAAASLVQESSPDTSADTAKIAALEAERDRLLAERASWAASNPATLTEEEAQRAWDAEKAELLKSRDEAAAQATAAQEHSRKLEEELFSRKRQFEFAQTKLRETIEGRNADKAKAIKDRDDAVTAAIEKAKSEQHATNSVTGSVPDPDTQKQAEELKALEDRLLAKHKSELDAAVAAARKEASTVPVSPDVSAALATQKTEFNAKLEVEIAAAVDRGRKEAAAKAKVKDQQLVRAQLALKNLEAQVSDWRAKGLIPEATSGPSAVPPSPSVATHQPTTQPVTKTPLASSSKAPVTPSLPSKPVDGVGRGRGTGARVAPQGRGLPAGRGRVSVPPAAASAVASAAAKAASAPLSGNTGVSIHGAATQASKRAREDSGDGDSLSKRLKPGGGPPVPIKRPPPPQS